jgi:hypothetical protein
VRKLKRHAAPLLVLLALAVAGGGYLLAVAPQRSQATALESDLAPAQVRLATLERERAHPASLHAADLFRLAKAMPAGSDVPGILVELGAAARASSVTLVSVTPGAAAAGPQGSTAIPLSLVLRGRYAGVSGFLRRLRGAVALHAGRPVVGGRLFLVDQVQLTAGTGREVNGTLDLKALAYGTAAPAPAATTTTTTEATS